MENSPACPATPPSAYASPSCTSPLSTWPRALLISVGAVRARSAGVGAIGGARHRERGEDASMDETIERLVRDRLDDEAEHVHADVGVQLDGSGLVLERGREHEPSRLRGRVRELREIASGRKPRTMFEELADRDARLRAARECREIARDRRVERDAMRIVEHHHRRGGRDDFRERGEIVQGALGRDRGARGRVVQRAIAPRHDGRVAPSDDHGSAGKSGGGHRPLEHAIDRRRAARPTSRRCRARAREAGRARRACRGGRGWGASSSGDERATRRATIVTIRYGRLYITPPFMTRTTCRTA